MNVAGARERLALQVAVATASLVPILAGGAGILMGPAMIGPAMIGSAMIVQAQPASADLDSHYRYLSGLLFAIGIGFLSTVPRIERYSARFGLLTAIVVAGGIARAVSVLAVGPPSWSMGWAFAMELLVTPALALWQRRIAAVPHDPTG